jgi:hypothetical protein
MKHSQKICWGFGCCNIIYFLLLCIKTVFCWTESTNSCMVFIPEKCQCQCQWQPFSLFSPTYSFTSSHGKLHVPLLNEDLILISNYKQLALYTNEKWLMQTLLFFGQTFKFKLWGRSDNVGNVWDTPHLYVPRNESSCTRRVHVPRIQNRWSTDRLGSYRAVNIYSLSSHAISVSLS